jgi:intracellular sulfur oxidation DsrE/DsrF family protein
MNTNARIVAVLIALVLSTTAPSAARAASDESLAVPGYPVAREVPNAHELPDPGMDYKIVWGIGQGAKDHTAEVNPSLPTLAQYVNTLAKWGVPAEKRHIIVMFHQRSADFDIVMNNDAYKAKYGKDNPNIALIKLLKKAGVEFRACGQAVVGRKIDAKDVNPDIQVDLWAMTTFFNLQMKGFARAGN